MRGQRKMIGLKASTDDERQLEAIRKRLGNYAKIADALREAIKFYCYHHKLEWRADQLPTAGAKGPKGKDGV